MASRKTQRNAATRRGLDDSTKAKLLIAVGRILKWRDIPLIGIEGLPDDPTFFVNETRQWFEFWLDRLSDQAKRITDGPWRCLADKDAQRDASLDLSTLLDLAEVVDMGDPATAKGFMLGLLLSGTTRELDALQGAHLDDIKAQIAHHSGKLGSLSRSLRADQRAEQVRSGIQDLVAKGMSETKAKALMTKSLGKHRTTTSRLQKRQPRCAQGPLSAPPAK